MVGRSHMSILATDSVGKIPYELCRDHTPLCEMERRRRHYYYDWLVVLINELLGIQLHISPPVLLRFT